jgi:protein-disulfide isomerase
MGQRRKRRELAARHAGQRGLFISSPLVAVVALVVCGGLLFAAGYFTNELMGEGEESSAVAQPTPNPTAAPTTVVGNVSADDDPALGPADAAVTVIEFSDYQ